MRIAELDGLRGAAIFSVLLWHYFYFFPDAAHHPSGVLRNLYLIFERCIAIGWSGVDLFFVLSGFLIGGILMDAKGSPNYFRAFYVRRFYRIIPLYYAWIILYFLVLGTLRLGITGLSEAGGEPGAWTILAHFLFLQNLGFVTYSGIALAWFTSTWSLAVEEQFYLIAPLMVRIFSRRVLPLILSVVVIAAPLMRLFVRAYWHPAMSLDPAYILMPCRADALSMGMLAAYFYREASFRAFLSERFHLVCGLWTACLAGVVALTWWSPDQHSMAMISGGYTWLAFFYVLTLLLALASPGGPLAMIMRTHALRELGRISYCVYIIHQAVMFFVPKALPSFVVSSTVLRVGIPPIVAIVLTISAAQLSWRFFERRLIARGHTYAYLAAQPESVA